jgi:threonine dehydrogenase-like Zn-dependent dehydrogenase
MEAAVLSAPGVVALGSVPVPVPGPGEALVRIEGCGVCGSNLPAYEGRPWFEYPFAPGEPGHEGWGVVEAVGAGVSDVAPGTRVAALSYRAFAGYDVAAADALVPLPAELDGEPFPGEALGCALNVFRRSGIEAGQTVAVVGVGFLGALLVQLAARAGAEVIAVSRRPFALELARRTGAAETVTLDEGVVARVEDLTENGLCDVAIEAAGAQATLDVAAKLTRVRGRLVVAGFHQDGPRRVDMQLWNWRGLDVVNAHERDPRAYVDGMRAAVDAVVSGRLDPAPLYTHRFPLERAGEALETARTRPDGFLKALLER